jgi:prepilin-type N-terminal cleavage/methylation domain-containing protein
MENKKYSSSRLTFNVSRFTLKAFTLIEMLIVILIATLILAVAINSFPKQRKIYTYQQYMSESETTVRMAKLKAVERSVNVSVCPIPVNNSIVVYDKGLDRSYPCDGNGNIIYTINIDSSVATVRGGGFSFDPRGLGIIGGNICIQSADGSMYYKISVQALSGRINIQKGSGGC